MYLAMYNGDISSLELEIKRIFASIPHDWLRKNNLAKYEGYYSSVVYSYFCGMGLDVTAEDTTNKGRIDLTIKLGDKIYIIEFKTEKAGKKPLEQIKERGYHEKYTSSPSPLLGKERGDRAEGVVGEVKDTLASQKDYKLPTMNYQLFLIGIEFDEKERNLTSFEWERV
jgi:hypothetical protein